MRRAFVSLSVLVLTSLPRFAAGQPAEPPEAVPPEPPPEPPPVVPAEPPVKERARELLREGNQLAGEGDWAGALDRYHRANELFPSAKLLVNIGTSLRQLGRNAEAARAYEAYVRDPSAEPARREQVERILREIQELLARVRVDVSEAGAGLRLDGLPIARGQREVVLSVDAGEHTIVAEKPGRHPAVAHFRVGPREQRRIVLELVDVSQPAPAPIELVVTDQGAAQRVAGISVATFGALALGAGAVLGIVAIETDQDAEAHCKTEEFCDPKGVSLDETARTEATVSTIGLSIGSAALATGAVLFFLAPAAPDEEPVVVEATAGGIMLKRRW